MLLRDRYLVLGATLSLFGVQSLALPRSRYSLLEPLQDVLAWPFAKNKPCSAADDAAASKQIGARNSTVSDSAHLRELVKMDFHNKMDEFVWPKMEQLNKYWAVIHSEWPGGDFNKMTIAAYKPGRCKTVINDAFPLADGIDCTTSRGCEYSLSLATSKQYENTVGAAITVTAGAGADFKLFSAKVDVAITGSYEHKWVSGESSTHTYSFSLAEGEHCVPAMMHVELECEVEPQRYFWDNYKKAYNPLRPEDVLNRKGGPFEGEQWCKFFYPQRELPEDDTWWKQLLEDRPDRGSAWAGKPEDLLPFYLNYDNSTLIIRPQDQSETAILCRPARTDEKKTETLPLNLGHALPGYVACLRDLKEKPKV